MSDVEDAPQEIEAARKIMCVMSGDSEAIEVHPIGRFGVAFKVCDSDFSVIADRLDDLVWLRDLLNERIAAREACADGR